METHQYRMQHSTSGLKLLFNTLSFSYKRYNRNDSCVTSFIQDKEKRDGWGVHCCVHCYVHPTHRVYSSQVVTTTTAQESHVHNIVMLITKNILKKKGGGVLRLRENYVILPCNNTQKVLSS